MKHLTTIQDIEQALTENRLCLFYIKAPDCGVCSAMLGKVEKMVEKYSSLVSFYSDITDEPLIAGRFLVYSGPTVLLLLNGKEVYRDSQFIDVEKLEWKITQYLELRDL